MNMKKIALALLSGAMLLGVSACTSQKPEGEEEEITTGVVNPIKEVTEEEMTKITGIDLPPIQGMENIVYSTINDTVAQAEFDYNGHHYCLRARPTFKTTAQEAEEELGELAGLYYEWQDVQDTTVKGRQARLYVASNNHAYVGWVDVVPGIEYILNTDDYSEDFIENASNIFIPMQDMPE